MKVSYNWLKNYYNDELSVEEIAQILTDTGLEVGGVERFEQVKGGLEGLVIGEVLTKEQHPDADRLSLTTVDVGGEAPLSIVCGAPNVAAGQKVVVATIGTVLYTAEGESFKIKKGKIRGQESHGMICAEDEIGLGDSHEGIMVLDQEAKVGTPAKTYFKLEDDHTIEIDLTPNRTDAMGHIGVARDLLAYRNVHGGHERREVIRPDLSAFHVDNNDFVVDVEVEDVEACPRYSGLTISNIKVGPSPDWLQNRLKSIGLSPINNVVDVTNFVLHEMGHPLHAFDGDEVSGRKVVVKKMEEGSEFVTLDDQTRKLSAHDLMICNAEEGMCIAGVFGGAHSGVKEGTTKIFLESAYFNPVSIRKTAKRHGLNTDASFRYERGADPNITIDALKRAAMLIKEVAGGEISSDIVDIYPQAIPHYEVDFTFANCERIAGIKLPDATIVNILESLEIEIVSQDENGLQLKVPPFRNDVTREIDVIEEVLRVYGYNNISMPEKLSSSLAHRQHPDPVKLKTMVSETLIGKGFSEIMNNSLTSSAYYGDGGAATEVRMLNPLSSELDVLRQSMIYGGLESIRYNVNRRSADLKYFEFGKTYKKEEGEFKEREQLVLFMTGKKLGESWETASDQVAFYDLKMAVERVLERLGVAPGMYQSVESNMGSLAYGLGLEMRNKKWATEYGPLALFGQVDTAVLKQADLTNEVYYAEINWDLVMVLMAHHNITYSPVPKYPSVRRDLALLLDQQVTFAEVEAVAQKVERKLLKEVNLFDIYEGDQLEKGTKSYAVSFVFQDDNKTLTDKHIDKVMDKMIKSYSEQLGASLR